MEFEFINQGISVNDVLHKYCWPEDIKIPTTPQQTEANYRALLSEIKKRPMRKF